MDVINRIIKLRDARNWSTYQLALEAELTQSTLSSLLKGGSSPNLKTIECLCKAFDMSLAQFFEETEETVLIDNDEKILLDRFRSLSPAKKKAFLEIIS